MKFVVLGYSRLIRSNPVNKLHHPGDVEVARRFAQTHDEEAFTEIVNSYGDRIFRTASH